MNIDINTTSLLSLYDLKGDWVLLNKGIEGKKLFTYPIDRTLKSGLRILIRSDAYYVLDFSNAPIGQSIPFFETEVNTKGMTTINERVEIMHAFLACLRTEHAKIYKQFHCVDMDFLDNYILCPNDDYDFNKIISSPIYSNLFSTQEYRQLCKIKFEEKSDKYPNFEIDKTDIYDKALELLDTILLNADPKVAYITGIMYRAAVYHRLNLKIQSATLLRSIFEWLAFKHSKKENVRELCKEDYEKLLEDFKAEDLERKALEDFRLLRNDAVHKLSFPEYNDRFISFNGRNHGYAPFTLSFKFIRNVFNKMFKINLAITFGEKQIYPS